MYIIIIRLLTEIIPGTVIYNNNGVFFFWNFITTVSNSTFMFFFENFLNKNPDTSGKTSIEISCFILIDFK